MFYRMECIILPAGMCELGNSQNHLTVPSIGFIKRQVQMYILVSAFLERYLRDNRQECAAEPSFGIVLWCGILSVTLNVFL